ncbi:glucosaminidase domain-containing protein [Polaribacter sp. MSW13]|uniref:Peptidoglycan hydrolase n=1 Tax=Polaribacter marinus TaxID=2916838 RepID=A0A9X1VMZ8_9FLAO|nr:glucosaminidase domain-containing protein [Polaribacter marinus]MCI2229142.1 glucosaminidase domain-containing protein [Polaribacter marinus]
MKLRVVLYCVCLLVLASCGSSKKTTRKKKGPGVVLNEPKPEKLPSVNEKEITKKLVKKNPKLNKSTLAYIRKYAPIAVKEMHDYKIPASITLAQGILESGNGKSKLASKSNNHFGIKCHTSWKGERVYHDDDSIGECFRKYKFVETSYNDHSEFLFKRKRYAFLFNYNIKDYKKWAKGLRKAGYATDRKYPSKLIGLIETYDLHEFDKIKKKDLKNQKKTKKTIKPKEDIQSKKATTNYYQVKKGDTLYSIATKFKTTVALLKEVNGLKDNIISIGQKLIIK